MRHKFVEFIPEDIESGIVYISGKYKTAVHNCICGCGNKVVTPLSPTDWELTFNGKSISLSPSIGNWNFDCRSHYWIKKSKIEWAEDWSKEMIQANRKEDRKQKEIYFKEQNEFIEKENSSVTNKRKKWWDKLKFWN